MTSLRRQFLFNISITKMKVGVRVSALLITLKPQQLYVSKMRFCDDIFLLAVIHAKT